MNNLSPTVLAAAALLWSLLLHGLPNTLAAEDAPSQISRRTIVSADRSGVVAVTLPRATPTFGKNALRMSLAHQGDAAVAALVQQDTKSPAVMIWTSLPNDVACPPCAGHRVVLPLGSRHGDVLPRGVYRIYLLSRSGKVTARLTAPSLTGKPIHIRAQRHPLAKFRVAAAATVAPTLRSGGWTTKLARRGIVYRLIIGRSNNATAMRSATCIQRGRGPRPAAYLPGCPAGREAETYWLGGYVAGEASADFNAPPGLYGQGGSVVSNAPIEDALVVAVWLPY